jgi:hypothetical protein
MLQNHPQVVSPYFLMAPGLILASVVSNSTFSCITSFRKAWNVIEPTRKTWERMGQPKAQGWSIFQDKQLGRIEDCIESVVVPSFLLQTTKNIQNPTKIHMVLKITFHMKMSIQWEQDKSTCLPRKLNQPPWFEPVDAQLPRQSHLSYFCTRFGHLYPTYSHVVLCFKNKAPMNPQIGQFYMLYYQTIHWVGSIIVTHIQSNDLE